MCYPEKMAPDAYEFFRTRFGMHNSVYTHKVVKAVEYMYVDAMLLADNFIKINRLRLYLSLLDLTKVAEAFDHP
jgi:HD superfamily phosphohydrolase